MIFLHLKMWSIENGDRAGIGKILSLPLFLCLKGVNMEEEVNQRVSLGMAKKDVESLTELAFECIAVVQ